MALVIFVLRSLDVLGLDEALMRHTTQTVSRFLSAFYPPPLDPVPRQRPIYPPPTGLQETRAIPDGPAGAKAAPYAWNTITVVEIDEHYLAGINAAIPRSPAARAGETKNPQPLPQRWPLSLQQIAKLLSGILDSKPQVVFLDFIISQSRPGIDDLPLGGSDAGLKMLVAVLDRARDAGIPVILADSSKGTGKTCPPSKQADAINGKDAGVYFSVPMDLACAAAAIVPVSWRSEEGEYPLSVTINGRILKTPAAEIFAQLQPRRPESQPHKAPSSHSDETETAPAAKRTADHAAEQTHTESILVTWGPGGFIATNDECRYRILPRWTSLGWWLQLFQISRETILPSGDAIGPERESCHHSNRISAARLLSNQPFQDRDEHLRGRIVLVGPAWETVPDTVVSPVLGRIPGVYLHAMALDNLISFRGHPYVFETFHTRMMKLDSLLFSLIIGFGVGVGRFVHGMRVHRPGWRGWLGAMLVEWAASTAAILPVAIILAMIGGVSPIVWLGAPLTLILIEPILLAAGGHAVPPPAEPKEEATS